MFGMTVAQAMQANMTKPSNILATCCHPNLATLSMIAILLIVILAREEKQKRVSNATHYKDSGHPISGFDIHITTEQKHGERHHQRDQLNCHCHYPLRV
ncbi:MAG: hypothetical protein ACJA09_000937 [Alcanivorax sp.]|jgi:hypothetical protein